MRTTVDLPADILRQLKEVARDRDQTLSATITSIVEQGFARATPPRDIAINPRTGLPSSRLGRPTTLDDVRLLDDDE